MPNIHTASAPTTTADRLLLKAICERRVADYSTLPEADRRIDARVLQALLAGDSPELPGRCCPVRIRGACIEGPLLPLSGHAATDGRTVLQFLDCRFDSVVDFSGVDFLSLRIVDCELPAFIGTSIGTKADLDFSGSCFTGIPEFQSELGEVGACAVHLSNARIGGHLLMDSTPGRRFSARGTIRVDGARVGGNVSLAGATLDGQGAESLSARSITVGGNVDLVSNGVFRFEAIGEVSLVAAHVTGDLSMDSARLYTPQGRALHCEDLKVESVFLSTRSLDDHPFEASGRLNFLSATIGGSFFLTSARLDPGPDYQGLLAKGGPVAVNMRQMRISNALALSNLGWLQADLPVPSRSSKPVPIPGWFMLSGAQISTLADDVSSGWPAAGFLDLEGLRYERAMQLGKGDLVSSRTRWLKLQYPGSKPDAANFRPQPYEHLASVLRAHGQTREADAIAVEKIRARLGACVDPAWARVFPRLLMLISHHGYSSSRAVLSFLLFVILGSVMYATAIWGFDQKFVPVQEPAEPTEYVLILDVARKQVPLGCPGMDVLHYALDAALPVIDLGQDAHCRFVPEGPGRALWLLLHSLYVIVGTALSAVAVLTLTGVMRRE